MSQDNLHLTELLSLLRDQPLPDEAYRAMIALIHSIIETGKHGTYQTVLHYDHKMPGLRFTASIEAGESEDHPS